MKKYKPPPPTLLQSPQCTLDPVETPAVEFVPRSPLPPPLLPSMSQFVPTSPPAPKRVKKQVEFTPSSPPLARQFVPSSPPPPSLSLPLPKPTPPPLLLQAQATKLKVPTAAVRGKLLPPVPVVLEKKPKLPPNHALVFTQSKIGKRNAKDERPTDRQRKEKAAPTEWKFPERRPKPKAAAVADLAATFTTTTLAPSLSFSVPVAVEKQWNLDHLIARQRPATLKNVVGQGDAIGAIRHHLAHAHAGPILLVGSSGVGKTTCARLACAEKGWKVYEYSPDCAIEVAGAKRTVLSVTGIDEVIYKLAIRSTVFEQFAIVLDDIGSIKKDAQTALAEVLSGKRCRGQFGKRTTQAPFVLTCDAADLSSIAIVARECTVIEMGTSSSDELMTYIDNVCASEQIDIAREVKAKVVEGCGGDVRRLLNTLHFIALHALDNASPTRDTEGTVGGVDCSTMFYNQHGCDLLRTFLADTRPLVDLSIMEEHPVSLAMLLAENMTPISDNLDCIVEASELLSAFDHVEAKVYNEQQWELQEMFTTLSTWGVAKTLKSDADPVKPKSKSDPVGPYRKSAYFGWKQRRKYRSKLIATLPLKARGTEFIDIALLLCEKVSRHTAAHPDFELVSYLKSEHYEYKDVQDVWKAAHLRTVPFPNPRGNNSLRKLLK